MRAETTNSIKIADWKIKPMTISFKMLGISLILILLPLSAIAGPYPPAAEKDGSTAVRKDDPAFVGWASDFENYFPGAELDSTWETPEKALGPAVGDSFDIVSLGRGGEITLTFDPPIKNGTGWDFAVFENSFSDTFLELAYIEVSSDGETFVRFDNDSLTNAPVGGFGSTDPTNIDGYAGKYRQGFGTPFDLDDLATKAVVLSGAVQLSSVARVRIIDVIGDGSDLDSDGDVIYDPYPTFGSAGFDLEAVGVRYIKDDSQPAAEIDPPALILPENGTAEVALNPTLQAGPFSARNLPAENFHARTHWQIARDAGFTVLVTDVISPVSLTAVTVVASTLSSGTEFFWRAKYIDNDGVKSDWAAPSSFTTTATSNDQNSNGIADQQELEPASTADLNRDGVPDLDQISDQFKVMNGAAGASPVAVETAGPNVVIEYIETLDPAALPDTGGGRPREMVFGLVSFRVRVQNAGDRETLTVYLADPAPAAHNWVKFDAVKGWYPFNGAIFQPDRRSLTFTLEDGGQGDADGLVNGIIIDPAGVGGDDPSGNQRNIPSSGSAGISGGGGTGCYISTTFGDGNLTEYLEPAVLAISVIFALGTFYLLSRKEKREKGPPQLKKILVIGPSFNDTSKE